VIDWNGPRRQPCPVCDRGQKDRACGVGVDQHDGKMKAHCFRCGYVETQDDGIARQGANPGRGGCERHEVLSAHGRELWNDCRPISGEARAYLESRSCRLPPADGDLRWHPALKHPPSGLLAPALVALATDARDHTKPLTLHRTWVRPDGTKAALEPPRMLLAGHCKAGGVIRLWPEEAVTHGLGICEGIESALAFAHGFTPAWSCIDAGNLAALPVLPALSLVIGADNDEAGRNAANACAARWRRAGATVRILLPQGERSDWNDEARGHP
jgi:putative DNA primase/helicase